MMKKKSWRCHFFVGNARGFRYHLGMSPKMREDRRPAGVPDGLEAYARRYAKVIYWSDEDNCYIGSLPEICGNCCHGGTEAEVLQQLDVIALDLVEDKARGLDLGTVPEPGEISFITRSRFSLSKNVHAEVAKLRHRLGLSQAGFAKALGVSLSTVGLWEQGRRKPDGASSRLLEIAAKHPDVILGKVR